MFALTGQVEHSGLIEVPMGTTINEIVNEIGGGVPNGKKLKAVQTGGPSGGVISGRAYGFAGMLRGTQKGWIDYGVRRHDCDGRQGSNMVNIANFYLDFTVDESLRKMRSLSYRRQADAAFAGENQQGQRHQAGLGGSETGCAGNAKSFFVRPGSIGRLIR